MQQATPKVTGFKHNYLFSLTHLVIVLELAGLVELDSMLQIGARSVPGVFHFSCIGGLHEEIFLMSTVQVQMQKLNYASTFGGSP
jgi:hypothetical protein